MINGKLKIFTLNLTSEKVDQGKDDEFIPANIGDLVVGSTGDTN